MPARAVSAHALIIGNGAYAGSGRLDNPVNDAKAMSRKLRDLGFTVTEVNDANRAKLVNAFALFSRTAASAEISLLYYSGHGVQIYGTNYVLPIDVDQNDIAQATLQGVSLNSVIEQFMPGKTKLVFLDACRDNPLVRTASRGMTKGLAPISVSQGTLIAYSTKDGQVALDGVGDGKRDKDLKEQRDVIGDCIRPAQAKEEQTQQQRGLGYEKSQKEQPGLVRGTQPGRVRVTADP